MLMSNRGVLLASRRKTATPVIGESRTKQSFRDDADINVLVRRFAKTGVISQVDRVPLRGDFTETMDYRSMQDALRHANESFMSLPSEIRDRFGHDPARFVTWSLDKDNLPELRKLGLAKPEPVAPVKPEPMEVRVVGTVSDSGNEGNGK